MQYKDYYKIMGVDRKASPDDIKRAYRKLARKYHPDVSKESNAEEKFKDLGEAYEVLKDHKKRAAYDELGENWQAGQEFKRPPQWEQTMGGGGVDFDGATDFFEALFGHRKPRHQAMQGENYHSKIQVSLEDAAHGTVTNIHIPIQEIDPQGHVRTTTRTLKVKIPAGVKSGQQIRLAGQGGPGRGTGAKGDLYLEIELQKHPFFDVIGNDIYCTLPVTPWEAALGATVAVPTLSGKVDMKIPAHSQGGQTLRLKNRGLSGEPPGDQYVILKIMIPAPTTDNAKSLYEQMSKEMPFNPREKLGG
jgi:curved DNA-binding protein